MIRYVFLLIKKGRRQQYSNHRWERVRKLGHALTRRHALRSGNLPAQAILGSLLEDSNPNLQPQDHVIGGRHWEWSMRAQVVSSSGLQQRFVKPLHRRHVVRLDTGELRLKCVDEYSHVTDAADHDEDSCIRHGTEKSIDHV